MKQLKIAILGDGKMGKMIRQLAVEQGHNLGCIIDNESDWKTKAAELKSCDVAIDFSIPATAFDNLSRCFALKLPIVIGTTGWYDRMEEVRNLCMENNASLFYAPNFSPGMNIVFHLNRQLAKSLNGLGYSFRLEEKHHIHKLDAPSGTAIQLANDIINAQDELSAWEIAETAQIAQNILPVFVSREGEVNGYHSVEAVSNVDMIRLSHEAFSRESFALGAIKAAEFVVDKKGIFTMTDLLQLSDTK